MLASHSVPSLAKNTRCRSAESPCCRSEVQNKTNAAGSRCSPDSCREPGRPLLQTFNLSKKKKKGGGSSASIPNLIVTQNDPVSRDLRSVLVRVPSECEHSEKQPSRAHTGTRSISLLCQGWGVGVGMLPLAGRKKPERAWLLRSKLREE